MKIFVIDRNSPHNTKSFHTIEKCTFYLISSCIDPIIVVNKNNKSVVVDDNPCVNTLSDNLKKAFRSLE